LGLEILAGPDLFVADLVNADDVGHLVQGERIGAEPDVHFT
jgi:hypothetical protein